MRKAVMGSLGALSLAAVTSVAFLYEHEGTRNHAYVDPVGVVTICQGWTKDVKMGDYYSDDYCKKLTTKEVVRIEKLILKHVKRPVPPKVMQSLVTWTFNVGDGAFLRSTLLKELNAYGPLAACFALADWHFAKKKNCFNRRNNCYGVVDRRAHEIKTCLEGAL